MAPVTNYDFTAEAAIERLQKLLATPPLHLGVEGGGVPDPWTVEFREVVFIERREVEHLIWLLRRPAGADAPAVVQPR